MKMIPWQVNTGAQSRGRTSSLSNPEQWVSLALGAQPASAGPSVSVESALRHSAVFKCVKILAETISMLPLLLYRRLPTGGKERASARLLFRLLRWNPNSEMSSYTWRLMMNINLVARGNAYAWVQRNGYQEIMGLWPIPAPLVRCYRSTDELEEIRYDVTIPRSGRIVTIPARNMLHLKGFTLDGLTGVNPIEYMRESIGLSMASEQYGAKFYANGGQPKGVLEHPSQLGDEAGKHLREQFDENYSGLSHAMKTLILEEGMKYNAISVAPADAQYLEARRFSALDIAGIFRVPPHMVNELERATFNNMEQMGMSFTNYTLAPWFVAWEQEIYRTLLDPTEQETYFAEHLVDALLRGDLLTRYRAYAIGRQNSWLNADEIREIENMSPIPDGSGQVYTAPRNTAPLDMLGAIEGTGSGAPQSTAGDTSGDQGGGARGIDLQPLADELAERVTRRAAADLQRAAGKQAVTNVSAWARGYFTRNTGEHAAWVATSLQPFLEAAGVDDAAAQARTVCEWWCGNAEAEADGLLIDDVRAGLARELASMLMSYPAETGAEVTA